MSESPVLLLTGATGPVGEAVAALLAKRGDRLLLTGRNTDRLAQLERTYGTPGQVETFAADVTTAEGATAAADQAEHRFGRLDGLIHMIGSFQAGPSPIIDHGRLLAVNFLSAVHATHAVLPRLGNGGRLVYFGSPLAQEPLAFLGGYAAAKAALLAWVRALSHEVKDRGVHANAIVMTMADTPEARRDRPHADFGQAVTPDQVARVVAFLTGEASDGVYGALVPVMGKFGFSSALAGPPPGKRP
ncbi:SDR family oxidoreductase [Microbispora sp. RL4-1S]|uniref:SDR family oxidoreductase n=1 Tax=Microbispora oryzae TaxID=2806554 RepID=A0A941AL76_9ACTN|nr:SDR family oxidoreductase [Microbispora oryzae]MBP2708280.1 SDR family oxidoreductase [Microbispora oryzae]